jgi:hypothetical protein
VDTSTEYVKMCDCPEIQGQHPWPDHKLPTIHINNNLIVTHKIWLPYQDQLQEMVGGSWVGQLTELWHGTTTDYWAQFKSWEQAWLAFVMRDKYNKHWTGRAWA